MSGIVLIVFYLLPTVTKLSSLVGTELPKQISDRQIKNLLIDIKPLTRVNLIKLLHYLD